jgi:hypothetical protein
MGSGRWSSTTWDAYSRTASTKSARDLYRSNSVQRAYDSKVIKLRESRDSQDNPNSTPIIIGLDVTGSMGQLAVDLAKNGLGITIQELYDRKPVSDPHVMIMAIGDACHDRAPLQATQFEADNRLVEQLTGLYLEGGGGGNQFESYDLPWIFASRFTSIDSHEKRGVKGYCITMGDELPPQHDGYRPQELAGVFGDEVSGQLSMSPAVALEEAQQKYNVFHLIIKQGSFCRSAFDRVKSAWRELMGGHAIIVSDIRYIPQIIISLIQVNEGAEPDDVIASWEDQAAKAAVHTALYE